MDHVFDILEKDQRELDAEKWPYLMVLAEKAYEAEVAMTEGMPEPNKVSGPVSYTHLTLPTICSV